MIRLSLERINAKSPYQVTEAHGGYEFRTEKGVLYRIRFLEENPIGGCDTYQFAISKVDDIHSSHDANISAVTFILFWTNSLQNTKTCCCTIAMRQTIEKLVATGYLYVGLKKQQILTGLQYVLPMRKSKGKAYMLLL